MPAPPSERSNCDDSVIRAAARGNRTARVEIVQTLLPRVRNLVRYLIRGDQEVDDVSQEALVAILRGLRTYRATGRFVSWADRIVARTTFAWLRRRRSTESQHQQIALYALADDAKPPPDEYLARREQVRLLDRLPDEQRHALVLHHALGMSVPEIATETRTPVETVRSRLRVARLKLREVGGIQLEEEAG